MTKGRAVEDKSAARGTWLIFGLPIICLAMGHMISNLVRTLPAIATDVLTRDLSVSAQELASLTGAFHLSFAIGQIPVGVALDRYGVRRVALALMVLVVAGVALAALARDGRDFLIAQIVLGAGCSGMLLCPMTFAAKSLNARQFGLWSGLIQGLGNVGMLISASPMAWMVEHSGWRQAFWASMAATVAVAVLVALMVPRRSSDATGQASLASEAREVLRIGTLPALRGVIVLALVSFAAVISLRGLWLGPWLIEAKRMSRLDAGNLLTGFTLALIAGPILFGLLDRRLGHRRRLLTVAHVAATLALVLLALGGPGSMLANGLGLPQLPAGYDLAALLLFGLTISSQALLFALGRATVEPHDAGKALSAVNLAFFLGAAIAQPLSGVVASFTPIAGVIWFFAALLLAGTVAFVALSPKTPATTPARS